MEELIKFIPEDDKVTYEKWKNMSLLPENSNTLLNVFLAKTYENFTNFILKLSDNPPDWWSECNFTVLYIPITRKLYTEDITDNYELIYQKFEEWYCSVGYEYKTDIEYCNNFIEYFKEFAKNNIPDDVKKYCIRDSENGGIVKSEYKKDILIKNLDFENRSENEKEIILNELSPLLDNIKLNICYFPIYKVNSKYYSVFETDDDIEVIKKYLSDGQTVSIFSAKVNERGDVVYRYNVNNKSQKL
jgi:hypothetical protein